MDTVFVDLFLPRRSFELELALRVGRETVGLVGPSGGGKTSVLRAVAGLERPRRGSVRCGDDVWFDAARGVDVPPERRSVGLVFQEYALFPHLTVAANVAFGGRRERPDLLERFRIAHLARARPTEISGGERQRVAVARALAREPKVLLLDEPMAALDPHTRASVREELRALLRELALPTLVVTHDFEDAAALAERVGVMVEGRLLQLGSPAELVAAPADSFVASFAGGNVLHGTAAPLASGLTEVRLDDGGLVYSTDPGEGPVSVVVYPWEVALAREAPADSAVNHVLGEIASLVSLGNRLRVRVGPLTAEVTAASAERLVLREGERVVASFKATGTRLLPREPRLGARAPAARRTSSD
jgi:ABC-type sulfate/molybdate transport systems ATPase subunit